MRLTRIDRGRIIGLALALVSAVSTVQAVADNPQLFTAGNTFASNSRYVSTTVFPWFTSDGGQISGAWLPLEGRAAWDGSHAFWETQIKQMMAANIDVLQVAAFPGWNQQRANLFQALNNLRAQGYNVPKVAPFLDTAITTFSYGWTPGTAGQLVDLGTSAGKDAFVNQYTQFYNQYYSVNADAYDDTYIAQIDDRVVLDSWELPYEAINVSSLTREDVQSRLAASLGSGHPLFKVIPTNGTFMINLAGEGPGTHFTFEDERLSQFEYIDQYYYRDTTTSVGRRAATLEPGFWNQNTHNPGTFLPRDGGSHYAASWTQLQADRYNAGSNPEGVRHAYVESWNEYDEGSGIYAANPEEPYIVPGSGNTNTDTWSSTNDPYEYIKTTAVGARHFNDTPDLGASILWHNLPTTMSPGQTGTYQVIVRNDGDVSWKGADSFKLGQKEYSGSTLFGTSRYVIDDASNEIPTYGGIFRGRPITFNVELTAPTDPGEYTTFWQMLQENVVWFGDEVMTQIRVPTTRFWNGASTSNWYDSQWSGAISGPFTSTWTENQMARFQKSGGGPYTITMNGNPSVNGISFADNAYTLTGGTLTLVGTSPELIIEGAGNTAVINSVLAGNPSITKSGIGTLVLGGANTFSGGLTVSAGKLTMGNSQALGNSANSILVQNGGAIDVNGYSTAAYSNGITVNGTGVDGSGALVNTAATEGGSPYCPLVLGSPSSVGAAGSVRLKVGAINGPYGLTKVGSGILSIYGESNYSGGLTVSAGTVEMCHDRALGDTGNTILVQLGAIDVNDHSTAAYGNGAIINGTGVGDTGALRNDGYAVGGSSNFNVVLSGDSSIGVKNSGASLIIGTVSGSYKNLTKVGDGTAIIAGDSTYYNTTISTGTLQIGNGGTTGSLGAGNVTNNAALVFHRSNDYSFSNVISGSGSLTNFGSGTLTLAGANTYAGATTINAGTLKMGNAQALGTGNVILGGGTLDMNGCNKAGAAFYFNTTGSTLANTMEGTTSVLAPTSAVSAINQDFVVNAVGNLALVGGFGNGSIHRQVTKIGAGTLTLGSATDNADNAGLGLYAMEGTVILSKNSVDSPDVHAVGGPGIVGIDSGATVKYAGTGNYQVLQGAVITLTGGTLDFNGNNQTGTALFVNTTGSTLANTMAGTTSVYTSMSAAINQDFAVNAVGNLQLSGALIASAPRLLTKNGSGTLILGGGVHAGVDNTYLDVQVNAGTVELNKNSSHDVNSVVNIRGINTGATVKYTGNGDYQVYGDYGSITLNGGTLDLNGRNQYEAPLTVNANSSTLANTASGTTSTYTPTSVTLNSDLTVNAVGNLTLTPGSAFSGRGGTLTKNGAGTLAMTTITRNTGTALNFVKNAGSITTGTANCNFTGGRQSILGGYATYGGTTWAVSGSGGTPGAITGLSTFQTTFAATNDVDAQATATINPTSTLTVNSVRFHSAGTHSVSFGSSSKTLNVASGGILQTSNSGAVTIGTTSTRGYLTSGNGSDLVVHQNSVSNMTVNSIIKDSIGLTKTGTGKLILTGANTYTGATNVNGGILLANNTSSSTSATGTGAVSVNNGGTFGGSGYITGNVTVASGGHLKPGATTGTTNEDLWVTGNVTLNSGSYLDIEFGTSVGNRDHIDLVGSSRSLNLAGILNATCSGTLLSGSYTIFTNVSSVTGSLVLPESGYLGHNWSQGLSGTNYIITAAPEPGTLLLAAIAGLSLLGYVMKKRT